MNERAEMIFTGDELLRGDIVNTNQVFLGEESLDIGLRVTHAISVADDLWTIRDAVVSALEREPGLILVSGGLGPTQDDLTREAVASAVGRELQERKELLTAIQERFRAMGVRMTSNNRRQAMIPSGAHAIDFSGTAPGFWLESSHTILVALPGVPSELKEMWSQTVRPLIEDRLALDPNSEDRRVAVSRLRISGMGESTLAQVIQEITSLAEGGIEVGTRASIDGITLILRARGGSSAGPALQAAEKDVRNALGDKVFGSGTDTLAEALGARLKTQHLDLATAESCTGGLISRLITDVPGSSRYFRGGVTAYSNDLKTHLLGVSPDLVEAHGAVSEEVARAMAQGAQERLNAHCALSTTGIAGPEGGSEQKPVGLVYICVALGEEATVRRFTMLGGRRRIRSRAAYAALDLMRRRLCPVK